MVGFICLWKTEKVFKLLSEKRIPGNKEKKKYLINKEKKQKQKKLSVSINFKVVEVWTLFILYWYKKPFLQIILQFLKMIQLTKSFLLRHSTAWTFKLKRYHMSPRWYVSKWLVKEEFKSQKFTRPFFLTKWGNYKTYQQHSTFSKSNGAFNKYCDMEKLHKQNVKLKK